MKANRSYTNGTKTKRLEKHYGEVQQWQSDLGLIKSEITFICHLLDTYTFEPNTSESFGLLQDYRNRIRTAREMNESIARQLTDHRAHIGGALECNDRSHDTSFLMKQEKLKMEVDQFKAHFQELKTEIFEYAIKIMKRRKP